MRALLLFVAYATVLLGLVGVRRRAAVQDVLVAAGWLERDCDPLLPTFSKLRAGQSLRACRGNCTRQRCEPVSLALQYDGSLELASPRSVLWRASPRPWWRRPRFSADYWVRIDRDALVLGRADAVLSTRSLHDCRPLARLLPSFASSSSSSSLATNLTTAPLLGPTTRSSSSTTVEDFSSSSSPHVAVRAPLVISTSSIG